MPLIILAQPLCVNRFCCVSTDSDDRVQTDILVPDEDRAADRVNFADRAGDGPVLPTSSPGVFRLRIRAGGKVCDFSSDAVLPCRPAVRDKPADGSEAAVKLLTCLLCQAVRVFVQNFFCGNAAVKSGQGVKGGKNLGAPPGVHGRMLYVKGIVGGEYAGLSVAGPAAPEYVGMAEVYRHGHSADLFVCICIGHGPHASFQIQDSPSSLAR